MTLTGLLLLVLAVFLGGIGWLLRRMAGLPGGAVVAEDLGGRPAPVLRAPRYGLSGRPDVLIRRPEGLIPVEVKSGSAPARPYDSHRLQLAAYCLLVEEALGERPPYGLIRYRDRTFRVDYTEALREELLRVLEAMRRDLAWGEAHRSHAIPARCRACGFRSICEEALE